MVQTVLGPPAALTSDGNGKFYGTTENGGANGVGGIFEFDPSGSGSITLKGSFDNANGAGPVAALTSAGNGKFYGTTLSFDGNGDAGIFEFDPSGSGSLHFIGGLGGTLPFAALTSAGYDAFWGTLAYGGVNGYGTIFFYEPGRYTINDTFSFDGANGANPFAALTSAGNGKFYGTTTRGGANDYGAIFEFDPGADSVSTPAPLPLMGAGAAFGWSRRLRRRIQAVRPVFPVGL